MITHENTTCYLVHIFFRDDELHISNWRVDIFMADVREGINYLGTQVVVAGGAGERQPK